MPTKIRFPATLMVPPLSAQPDAEALSADHTTHPEPAEGRTSRPDLPRERLLSGGGASLSDAELLALCLRTGGRQGSVLTLSERLIQRFGSLRGVLRAQPDALLTLPDLGAAKVAGIKVVLALAERLLSEEVGSGPVFASAAAVSRFLRLQLGTREREAFACLLLDTRHRLLRFEVLFEGTIDSASVHPRELVRRCLEVNAAAVILAHNHPSGVAEPSLADIALTERLQPLLAEVGVRLLDHIVVGRGQQVSMASRGLIPS